MDIRFFASNPLLFFKLDGRQKTEDRSTGHFGLQTRFNINPI